MNELRRIKLENTVIFRRNWDGSIIGFVPKNNIKVDSFAELEVILADYNISVITETDEKFLICVPGGTPMTKVMDAVDALGDFRNEVGISFQEPMLLVPAGMGRDFALA